MQMPPNFVQIGKLFVQIRQMTDSNLQSGLNVNCSLWMLLILAPSALQKVNESGSSTSL